MKILQVEIASALLVALMACATTVRAAESGLGPGLSRAQVIEERNQFLKSQHWNEASSDWVINAGPEPIMATSVSAGSAGPANSAHLRALRRAEMTLPLHANPSLGRVTLGLGRR